MNPEKKNYLAIAECISRQAHCGQKRWDGTPYITHPQRIAHTLRSDTLQAAAWLHDVIEDTEISLKDLENLGIPGPVLSAVKAITKRNDEEYTDYIMRVAKNPVAIKVKIKDLEDNLNSIPECPKQRADKYKLAKFILEKIDNGDWEI